MTSEKLQSEPQRTNMQTAPPDSKPNRLDHVTALRGLAALFVVFQHLFDWEKDSVFYRAFLYGWGEAAVAVFFIISGFVVYLSILPRDGSHEAPESPLRFLARRLARLHPVYLAACLVTVVILVVLTRLAPNARPFSPTSASAVAHFFFAVPFTGGTWWNPVFWTLAIEMQFYLFLALGMWCKVFANPHISRAFPLLVAALVLLSPLYPQVKFLSWSPLFALGMMLAIRQRGMAAPQWVWWICVGVFVGLGFLWHDRTPMLAALGGFLFLRFASWHPWPLMYLGTISYSLYAFHYHVMCFTTKALQYLAGKSWLWSFRHVLALLAAIVVADLLYRLVEAPSQVLATRLKSKRIVTGGPLKIPLADSCLSDKSS